MSDSSSAVVRGSNDSYYFKLHLDEGQARFCNRLTGMEGTRPIPRAESVEQPVENQAETPH